VSPTGYLPAVAAGITFPYEDAIPISYTSVLVGAALNLALVRGVLRQSAWLRARCERRRARSGLSGLERALLAKPVRIVALLRLPFLGNGTLNYLLSMSPLAETASGVASMMVGNAVGMAPGAVLFVVAGSQVRSLARVIVEGGGSPTAIGVLAAVIVAVLLSIVAVVILTRRVAAAERAATAAATAAAAASAAGSAEGASLAEAAPADGSDRAIAGPHGAAIAGPAPGAAAAPAPEAQVV
jgi:hypothetical protein